MPEGDTIHHAAHRIRPVLDGRVPDELATPHPRFGADRWPEKLAGRAVAGRRRPRQAPVPALRGRARHPLAPAHDRRVGRLPRWPALGPLAAPGVARAARRRPRGRAVRRPRARADDRLARALRPAHRRARPRHPGARSSTSARFLARLRADDPTRPIGDALLDQRTIAGIGNLWKCEGCFDAEIDPWRPTGEVSDDEALRVVRLTRPRMQQSARDGFQARGARDLRPRRATVPALRRDDPPPRAVGRQPHDILVRGMPALKRIGHKGADLIAPGNTLASFDAALAAGVDMVEFDVLPEHRDGTGRLVLAHDFEAAARREPADARAGPGPLRPGRLGGHRARRRPQDDRLRAARRGGAARVRPGRARAHLHDGGGEPARGPRRRARDPPGLVGAEAAARLPRQPVHARAGARRRAVRAHGAPRPGGARHPGGSRSTRSCRTGRS